MQDGTIKVQRGDDADLTFVFKNADGSPYNATGSSLRLQVRRSALMLPTIDKPVSSFTDVGTKATITLSKTDLALDVRAWLYELIFVDAAGNRRSSGYLPFYVTENIGQPQTVGVVVGSPQTAVTVSVEQFELLPGIPVGGTTNQVLAKKTAANNDTKWMTLATVATSGSYADLTGLPDLGQYATITAVNTALSNYLPLSGGTVTGVLTASSTAATGGLVVGNGTTGYIKLGDGILSKAAGAGFALNSNLQPTVNNGQNLGTGALYWQYLYATRSYFNSTAYIDGSSSGQLLITGEMAAIGSLIRISRDGSNYHLYSTNAANTVAFGAIQYASGDNSYGLLAINRNVKLGTNNGEIIFTTGTGTEAERGRILTSGLLKMVGGIEAGGTIAAAPASGVSEIASKAPGGQVAQFGMYTAGVKRWHFEADGTILRFVESGVDFPLTITSAATTGLIGFNREVSSRTVAPSVNGTYNVGAAALYYSNVYAIRHYFNSAAYLDGATSGVVTLTGRLDATDNQLQVGAGLTNATSSYAKIGNLGDNVNVYLDALSTNNANVGIFLRAKGTGAVVIQSDLQPSNNNARQLGGTSLYWSSLFATRQYLNSGAYMEGANSGYMTYIGNMGSGNAGLPLYAFTLGAAKGFAIELPAPTSVSAVASISGGSLADGTYYFKVAAYDNVGLTVASTEFSATVTGGGGAGSITVNYGNIRGAIGYRVYYSTATGTQANYFQTTNLASYAFTTTTGSSAGSPSTSTNAYATLLRSNGASYILGNNNFGIGTSVPQDNLHVHVGNTVSAGLRIEGFQSGGRINMVGPTGNLTMSAGDGGSSMYMQFSGNGPSGLGAVTHYSNGSGFTQIAVAASSGTPASNTGSYIFRQRIWNGTSTQDNDIVIKPVIDTTGTTTPATHIGFTLRDGLERLTIRSSGNVEVHTGNLSISSSSYLNLEGSASISWRIGRNIVARNTNIGVNTNAIQLVTTTSAGEGVQLSSTTTGLPYFEVNASNGRTWQKGDSEIGDAAAGVILKAPGGARYRVTVNDAGALVSTAL